MWQESQNPKYPSTAFYHQYGAGSLNAMRRSSISQLSLDRSRPGDGSAQAPGQAEVSDQNSTSLKSKGQRSGQNSLRQEDLELPS